MDQRFKSGLIILLLVIFAFSCGKNRGSKITAPDPVLVSPGAGAGPLKLGMYRNDVDKLLGGPEEVSVFDKGDQIYYHYYTKGLSVLFAPVRVKVIFVYSGIPGGYEDGRFSPFPGYTSKDITLRSSIKEVKGKYGNPVSKTVLKEAPIPSIILHYAGVDFEFVKDSGKLIYMAIYR